MKPEELVPERRRPTEGQEDVGERKKMRKELQKQMFNQNLKTAT